MMTFLSYPKKKIFFISLPTKLVIHCRFFYMGSIIKSNILCVYDFQRYMQMKRKVVKHSLLLLPSTSKEFQVRT
jgi:hypothetical protein